MGTIVVDFGSIINDDNLLYVDASTDKVGMGMNMGGHTYKHRCACCGRGLGLPNGDRGLCDGCEEDIPKHIPQEQYLTYMKEFWRKK